MSPFLKRNLLVPVSALVFAGLLFILIKIIPLMESYVQHLELLIISILIMIAVIVMLFWVSLGVFGGLTCLLLSMIFIYEPLTDLDPYYYSILILAFFISSFIGHYVYREINKSNQEYTVAMEKVQEDTNLIHEHFDNRQAEISAMEDKINSLVKLKSISDELSISLTVDEVVKIVAEKTFDKYKGDIRVLFYLVDQKRSELSLAASVKDEGRQATSLKKGGIFERWVRKNMQTLRVRDVNEDYRFSLGEKERKDDAVSIISKPLISESNLLGILRVDSVREDAFGQHDLRILDIIGELTSVALENASLYRKTEELAIRDSLTGLFVHRYFMERLEEEIKRGLRRGSSMALFMLDIDDFKKFNDKYGHIAGDIVLKNVSGILSSKASAGDIVCRYGGEEFAFIALDCGREDALNLGEEIRKDIQNSHITIRRERKNITVSIGIAMFPDDAKLKDDLVWESDRRLYQAKAKGKNRICSD